MRTIRTGLISVSITLLLMGCQSQITRLDCSPQQLVTESVEKDEILLEQVAAAPPTNRQRQDRARAMLEAAGCPRLSREAIRSSRFENIICTLPGNTAARIVIGAHYDKLGPGRGVADNWTGVVMMTQLLSELIDRSRNHTFQFIAFGEEEPGMQGAASFLRQDKGADVIAFINLDTLGLDVLKADFRSDENLLCLTRDLANRLGVGFEISTFRQITGDWAPFRDAGVPVIGLHTVDRRTLRLLHSRRDRLANVKPGLLEDAWWLVWNLTVNLDRLSARTSPRSH